MAEHKRSWTEVAVFAVIVEILLAIVGWTMYWVSGVEFMLVVGIVLFLVISVLEFPPKAISYARLREEMEAGLSRLREPKK